MYSEIFLADFAVFRVFGGISRDFAEIPEFRGSATAWNIRSPDRIAVSILKALFTRQKKIGSGPIKKLVWTGYFCRVNLQYHVSMKWIQTRFFLYVSSTSLLYKWLALISLWKPFFWWRLVKLTLILSLIVKTCPELVFERQTIRSIFLFTETTKHWPLCHIIILILPQPSWWWRRLKTNR